MPCVPIDSGKLPDPSFHKLATAVEAILNIFYLVEKRADDPEKLRELLAMSRIPLKLLKEYCFEKDAAHARQNEHRFRSTQKEAG